MTQILILEHLHEEQPGVIMGAYTTPSLAGAAAMHHAQYAFAGAGAGATLEHPMKDTIELWQDGARVEQWIYWRLDVDHMPT